MDSAYSFRMCPNREWFLTYEVVDAKVVLMKNNASCKVAGIGIVRVKMYDGVVQIFQMFDMFQTKTKSYLFEYSWLQWMQVLL